MVVIMLTTAGTATIWRTSTLLP